MFGFKLAFVNILVFLITLCLIIPGQIDQSRINLHNKQDGEGGETSPDIPSGEHRASIPKAVRRLTI